MAFLSGVRLLVGDNCLLILCLKLFPPGKKPVFEVCGAAFESRSGADSVASLIFLRFHVKTLAFIYMDHNIEKLCVKDLSLTEQGQPRSPSRIISEGVQRSLCFFPLGSWCFRSPWLFILGLYRTIVWSIQDGF